MSHSQSLSKTVVAPTRPYDFAYDPVMTVARQRVPVPVGHQPPWDARKTATTRPTGPYRLVPTQATLRAIDTAKQSHTVAQSEVLGKDRLKFVKRPVVPFIHAMPADAILRAATPSSLSIGGMDATQGRLPEAGASSKLEAHLEESRTRTIAIQTVFRESEAQTDPYTPDYITKPDEPEPEILALAHLKWGQGLPASQAEINAIHKMRDKKAFEASLPPLVDETSFQKRRAMLEAREIQEWQEREQEVRHEQQAKLQMLVELLKQRETTAQQLADARIEQLKAKKMEERDSTFAAINHERTKMLRTIGRAKAPSVENDGQMRDIIKEYAQFDSKVYAPPMRDGRVQVKNTVVDYGIPLLSNYQGLAALEKALPADLSQPVLKEANVQPTTTSAKSRKEQQVQNDLEYAHRLLMGEAPSKQERPVIDNVYKKFEPIQRPPTPTLDAPEDEDKTRAVLLLQRLLRGRAVQNMMYEGKQQSYQLIRELRLDEETQHSAQAAEDLEEEEDQAWAADTLQGEIVSQALDFLAKEVVRAAEEKKILQMVELAERTRRMREAEEGGRRQAEEMLRTKREQHFRAVVDEHQQSAERFVEQMLGSAMEAYVEQEAQRLASIKAENLDHLVNYIEKEQNTTEQMITSLVLDLLFPEVQRRTDKERDQLEQHRFVEAAHNAVVEAAQAVLNVAPRPSSAAPATMPLMHFGPRPEAVDG